MTAVTRRKAPIRILAAAALVLSAALAAAGASRAAAAAAAPASKRPPVVRATLSNGLRLLCRANDSSEIVSVVCLVRAGLPDESDEQAGLAALTAESLLKGTTTHPGASFAASVASAGGN